MRHAPHRSRTFALGSSLLLAADGGCFTGQDAEGLPCRDDRDCGRGQSCIDDFCGGPPPTECGNGSVEHDEECDEGDGNGALGACRDDCKLHVCGDGVVGNGETCDDGVDNGDHGACKTDCTANACGDGLQGPAEACDDGAENGPGRPCKADCTLAECGDRRIDPGEDCDDGEESEACDDDCTAPQCGDGVLNRTAGEGCDDGDEVDDPECLGDCGRVLFWDAMDEGEGAWTHEVVDGTIDDGWSLVQTRAASAPASWHSGMTPDAAGSTRLLSPAVELVDVRSPIRLRFAHFWIFDDCGMADFAPDGAVVEISADGGPFEIVEPVTPYPDLLDADSGCVGEENPLGTAMAFSHGSGGRFQPAEIDLDPFAGSTIRIGFRVGHDCRNCETAEGWYLDDVVVWGF